MFYLDCIKYPDGVSEHIEIVASIKAANGNIFPYVSEVVTNSPIPMQVCYTHRHFKVYVSIPEQTTDKKWLGMACKFKAITTWNVRTVPSTH